MNHSKYKSTLLLVLSMSLPMIISMAVNALYNIVDSYFVAKLRDEAMTALSIIFPIQNIINSIAVGFGVGANAIIAFYLGAKNKDKANLATTSTIILSVVHGIILTLVGLFILKPFISSYTTNQLVIEDALTYGSIVLLFTIIIQVEVAFEKIFQSTGRMKVSMISMIIGFVVNIVLDPILIFGINSSIIHIPSLEMKGAALATGIGQLATLISYLLFFILRPTTVKFKPICLKPNLKTIPQLLKEIYLIGIPAALNMALPSFLISGLNQILKTFGDQYILILGIYYKLQTFIYLSANGIIQGIRPLISYNYGAKNNKLLLKIAISSLSLILIIMVIGTLISQIFSRELFDIYTDDLSIIEYGRLALRIISIGFIPSSLAVLSQGVLEAIGRGLHSLIISLLRYIAIIIPLAYLLSLFLEVKGIYISFVITEIVASISSVIILNYTLKKLNILGDKNEIRN